MFQTILGETHRSEGDLFVALKRYITEMGMGVDVHGGDYTKAARRAVSDALRHSSLNFFKALDKSPDDMRITVKIAAGDPSAIDAAAVASEFPYGTVTVEPVAGGLDVPSDTGSDLMVIVNAAVLVCFDE
jgi:uncharacterized protein (TIGR02058 family)